MISKDLASLDRVAIGLSGLCAFHCAVTPVAVIVFPVLSACLGSDQIFHSLLIALVVPSSVLALTLGCRRHRNAAGLSLLVVAAALGHVEYWERPMTLGASALIVVAHGLNYRLCRSDRCEH